MTGHASHAPAAPLRYLALGDSYTVGEGIDPDRAWPVQLARTLAAGGVRIADPRIIATTGWTTDELEAAIDAADPARDHDLVSLLIGVNNQYRGRGVDEYREQFTGLLGRAVDCAGGDPRRTLVLSIPDWSVTPFAAQSGRDTGAIARALDAFNAVAAQQCRQRGVAFVDITPVSRARGGEDGMLASDGLHPSAAMHAEWARLALPVVRSLLAP